MSTLVEIEETIAKLPRREFQELVRWIRDRDADEWDRQIEEDSKSGKLDRLWKVAKQEIAEGKAIPLDEFLRNP
jgi:hypothetical protein